MTQPAQAVILAGGQGARLRPLTDTRPKPMLLFHGRPFLAYLIEQLRAQGIERIVMLVGYLADQIEHYFRDGAAYGVRMTYARSPVEAETGQRVRDARQHLDAQFWLLYCDNYCPLRFEQLWAQQARARSPAMMTVYANRDGYTRNNVAVNKDGLVVAYDPARQAEGLNGVDIGYALLRQEIFDYVPAGNVSLERTVYPALVARGLLHAFRTEHRYYSVGSHERLPLTEAFLAPQRAVILDRDGVLNVRPPRAHYVRSWDEFIWLPGSIEALRLLKQAGYQLALVTNQPGIARGAMTADDLDHIHERMQQALAVAGAAVDGIYACQHHWDAGCWCRKPNPGLLFQAQRDFHLDLTQTVFVGDDERDVQAGEAAGCQTVLLTPERSLLDWAHTYLHMAARVTV